MTNKELIAALEAADGPSKTLMWAAFNEIHGIARGDADILRRFCELLDVAAWESAALMLVPEGWRRRSIVHEDGRAAVQLARPGYGWPDNWGTLYASEAQAIVIAAIKAGGEG